MSDLKLLRQQIVAIDRTIIRKLVERTKLSQKIGKLKMKMNVPILDIKRERELLDKYQLLCSKMNIDFKLIKAIYRLIFRYSKKIQNKS